MQRYNSYNSWLQDRFGVRVYKVSVDGGFTCPNRDGRVARGGCTYCSNDSFRAGGVDRMEPVESQIRRGIEYLSDRFQAEKFIVYWQHYSNTYAPVDELRDMFSRSLAADSRIVGLSIGTRADCVEDEKLEMISELAREHYICLEYGLESIHDATLARLNRGHDFACYLDAIRRTKARDLPICAHLILGFPWETRAQMLASADLLNRMEIDFVKLHHLHVVRHTALGREYIRTPFPTLTCDEWVRLVCDYLEQLSPCVVVQRLFGWAPERDLIAPRWERSRAEMLAAILQELEARDSWQGKKLSTIAFKATSTRRRRCRPGSAS